MQIDVMPSKNPQAPGWVVVAHSPSGDCHDFGFKTQAEALEFALTVYGGTVKKVVSPTRQIPTTTHDRCAFYHTTTKDCSCPHFRGKQNLYQDSVKKDGICKHIHHARLEDFRLANEVADTWQKQEHIDREGNLLELPVPAVPAKTAAQKLTAEELFARLRA